MHGENMKLIQVSGYGTAEGDRIQKLGIHDWKTEMGQEGRHEGRLN